MSLTKRELEILQLLVDGLSRKQIACRLKISLPTVYFYIHQAKYKIGADTPEQMIARAISGGIISKTL